MLLKAVFPSAPADAQEQFIRHSMTERVLDDDDVPEGTDVKRISDYERYNVAAWLKQIAPESEAARDHFISLRYIPAGESLNLLRIIACH